jgi:peptide/nickel transport system ATP-binding protein
MDPADTPLVAVDGVSKHFDVSGGLLDRLKFEKGKLRDVHTMVKAVNSVSLNIQRGETLSVVGESGCGKSTLGRVVLGLYEPTAGEIRFNGTRIDNLSRRAMRPFRKCMQMVFQDPYASLNPRMTVRRILEEPLRHHNPGLSDAQVKEAVAEVMDKVGVRQGWVDNYPHEFSGGQRQRIGIARALMVDPEFIVADEPVSALDVSIQAQILNLLMDLQSERDLTYLFISHDLSVVEHLSTRVAVMYLGTLCESSPTRSLFDTPRHPYTQALLSAIPRIGCPPGGHVRLKGEVPSPLHLPSGCVFHGRCPHAFERCPVDVPKLMRVDDSWHWVACHAVEEGRL